MTSRLSELYPLIEERHASLPKDLNQIAGDDEVDESDEPEVEELDILCDILSSFDGNRTPSEFKHDFVDIERPVMSLDDVLVPGSMSGTIYRLAIYDEAFYRRLQQIVPPNVCASQYYNKQRQRAHFVVQGLDHCAQIGLQTGQARNNSEHSFCLSSFLFIPSLESEPESEEERLGLRLERFFRLLKSS